MNKLRPVDHDTQLIYECPNCESKHWKLIREVCGRNPAVYCHCGQTTEIQRLFKPRLLFDLKEKNGLTNQEISRARSLVKHQGFDKSLVDEALKQDSVTTVAQLVKTSISLAKESSC